MKFPPHQISDSGEQCIGSWDVFQPQMEVVEVVIDESSVGAFPFGNVRQEAASAEQIDECSRIGKPGQCFPELADKTAFLPLERQRGGSVNSLFLHSAKMFFIRLNSVELFIIFVASYLCTPAGHRTTNAKTPIRDQRIALGCAYRRIYVSAEVRDSLTAGGFFVPLCVMCMDQFFIIGGRFSGGMYGYFRLEMYRTHANRCRHHRRV